MAKILGPTKSFKGIGKCFFYPIEKIPGFTKKYFIPSKTNVEFADKFVSYNPETYKAVENFIKRNGSYSNIYRGNTNIPALGSAINIGKDYEGSVELPEGTQVVEIYELKNDDQILHFLHSFNPIRKDPSIELMVPFKNEFMTVDVRVNPQDFVPNTNLDEVYDKTLFTIKK